MACVPLSLLTTSSLPGRTSTSLPPRCVCGRFLVGVTTSPPQAAPRHQLGPSTCPFCHDVDGSLAHHLSSFSAHINAREAWAHSCGVSPPDVPTHARHGWMFNPLNELNMPQTIRAHIRFVGLVCERFRPLVIPPSTHSLVPFPPSLFFGRCGACVHPLGSDGLVLPGVLRGSSSARFVCHVWHQPDVGVFEGQFVTFCLGMPGTNHHTHVRLFLSGPLSAVTRGRCGTVGLMFARFLSNAVIALVPKFRRVRPACPPLFLMLGPASHLSLVPLDRCVVRLRRRHHGGYDQVWPRPSLAKTKFGQDQVWPDLFFL